MSGHQWQAGARGRYLWCPRCENSIRPQAVVKQLSAVSCRPTVVWINEENEQPGIPRCVKEPKR